MVGRYPWAGRSQDSGLVASAGTPRTRSLVGARRHDKVHIHRPWWVTCLTASTCRTEYSIPSRSNAHTSVEKRSFIDPGRSHAWLLLLAHGRHQYSIPSGSNASTSRVKCSLIDPGGSQAWLLPLAHGRHQYSAPSGAMRVYKNCELLTHRPCRVTYLAVTASTGRTPSTISLVGAMRVQAERSAHS